MAPILAVGLLAAGGYLWWKYKMPHKLTVHTVDGGEYHTSFAVDGTMSDFQKQEALAMATSIVFAVQKGTTTAGAASAQLRQAAKSYRDQGFPITAKSFEDSAMYIEGGGFPPWVGELPPAD